MSKSSKSRHNYSAKSYRVIMLMIVLSAVFILSACGADIKSSIVVDKDFAGERVITIDFKTSDNPLNSVDGGLDTIVALAEENLPSILKMSVGDNEISFTMSFNGLEDYKSQIGALFGAGGLDNEPVIEFTYADSIFAKRVYFYEDFETDYLVYWLFNAVEESGAVTESRGNWYDINGKTIEIAGVQYSFGYGNVVDEGSENYLDRVNVYTDYNADGTLDREIIVYASNYSYNWFAENGSDIDQYMADLAPANATHEKTYDDESEETLFSYKVKNTDIAGITAFTNGVLASDNASFDYKLEAAPDILGKAVYTVSEIMDFGFFVNDSYSYSRSFHNFSSVVTPVPGEDSDLHFEMDEMYRHTPELSYTLVSGEERTFACETGVQMNLSNATISLKNNDELDYQIEIVYSDEGSDDLIAIATSGLVKAAQDIAELADGEEGTKLLTYSGSYEDVVESIDTFLSRFMRGDVIEQIDDEEVTEETEAVETEDADKTDADDESDEAESDIIEIIGEYTQIRIKPQTTESRFTKAYQINIHTNWSSLFTNEMAVAVNAPDAGKAYIINSVTDEDGRQVSEDGRISPNILVVSTYWPPVIILAIMILIFLAAIVILLVNRAEIAKVVNLAKAKLQARRAAQAASQQPGTQAAIQQSAAQPEAIQQPPAQQAAQQSVAQPQNTSSDMSAQPVNDRVEEEDLI